MAGSLNRETNTRELAWSEWTINEGGHDRWARWLAASALPRSDLHDEHRLAEAWRHLPPDLMLRESSLLKVGAFADHALPHIWERAPAMIEARVADFLRAGDEGVDQYLWRSPRSAWPVLERLTHDVLRDRAAQLGDRLRRSLFLWLQRYVALRLEGWARAFATMNVLYPVPTS